MDSISSDLEFFDFQNVTEEEIREIQDILKGPGNNGCVELPWEIKLDESNNSACKGTVEISKLSSHTKEKEVSLITPNVQFANSQNSLTHAEPLHLLPPATENFVTIPTTIGYHSAPYFVSRTLPYLRAYHHVGMPFIACPIPGSGESASIPSPFSQFMPLISPVVGQEKSLEDDCQVKSPTERPYSRENKKKVPADYTCGNVEIQNTTETYKEAITDKNLAVSVPVSSTVNNERPTSVPIVPLPVQPSTFAISGGTLPVHGYPPGLHSLPYTQVSGHQAPSPPMYYVPVFNHLYGNYMPSPTSAAMVLPMNLHQETEVLSPTESCDTSLHESCDLKEALPKHCNTTHSISLEKSHPPKFNDHQNHTRESLSKDCIQSKPSDTLSSCSATSSLGDCNVDQSDFAMEKSNAEDMPLCEEQHVSILQTPTGDDSNLSVSLQVNRASPIKSSAKISIKNSPNNSSLCNMTPKLASDAKMKSIVTSKENKESNGDTSRSWADLFRKPCPEVNGIDGQQILKQNVSKITGAVRNGKVNSVPTTDGVH